MNKKPKVEELDDIPTRPISPANLKRLDRQIKKKNEKLRRQYPEIHGKKVDWITHGYEDGTLFFEVRFTDGKNFSITCSPTILTDFIDLHDAKTFDNITLRKYYRRPSNH